MKNDEIFSINNIQLDHLILSRRQGILSTEVDGETILLHNDSGNYIGLDSVGSFIWKQLAIPSVIPAIKSALLKRFEVEEKKCTDDLLDFLRSLANNGLIDVSSENKD